MSSSLKLPKEPLIINFIGPSRPLAINQAKQLPQISRDLSTTSKIKIENCVGFTQVPVGLAGPLTLNGTYQARKTLYAPLATVEPTLVAACSRGCKTFSACGGISTAALGEGLTRAPVFTFSTIDQALAFYRLAPSLLGQFQIIANKTSRHGSLVSISPRIIGSSVHVKFTFTCGDAAGQNMVTLATHAACMDLISNNRPDGMIGFQLDGNMSSDKKLSWGSVQEPRGVSVMAWGTISNDISRTMLGCSTKRLKTVLSNIEEGGVRNGQIGQCLNPSNITAPMFIACGQDVGSILESGFSHLTGEYNEETEVLTLSLFFPSMLVGSVGGGTGYATQKEALELIDCHGEGKKWALAETIAAFALALEISTLSALATDTFAASHKDLARGPKSKL
ncbi:hydroxymethylglutaryl-coenzyme A reductase family protein [Rhexocercosporidium sp. MPI-PUGE-AT-0058]|nr:hydroxymethylglutaryl-coenzyme A reductase family protein [Rhexocercosporidium sp. MPI-PUGE-AT-0058]